MTPVIWTVLAASLAGSPHCVGMCGAFAWMAAPSGRRGPAILYHGARVIAYAALGVVAGLAGHALNRVGVLAGAARLGTMLAGAVMLGWGLVTLAAALGLRVPRSPALALPMRLAASRIRAWPAEGRAAALGLATALLPCGLLYAFVAMAAASGDWLTGASVMLVFGLGTLPAFALLAVASRRAVGPVRRYLPMVTAAALVVVGAITMLGRMPVGHAMHHVMPGMP